MTTLLDDETAAGQALRTDGPDLDHLSDLSAEDGHGTGGATADDDTADVSPVTVALVAVSGALSAAGAAWMVGGMFRGGEARLVGLLGVLLGGGLSFAATRWRANFLHYLVLPTALLAGAALMSTSSGAGTSSLPALVKDAVTSSQVLQPPVDFAPGWRLILLVVLALLTAAASALALSLQRTRLAVAVPVPLTLAAALVQPSGSAVTTSAVSVGFVVMALATSYAADGAGDRFDTGFELRRLGRSAAAGVLLVAALLAASKVSFLFPQTQQHHVVPPRKPPVSPPQKDVPLYTVTGAITGPLRVGVIDVYDAKRQAWLLPPVDNSRLHRVHLPANLLPAPAATVGAPERLTVTVNQATGHVLPDLSGTYRIAGSATVDYDPRTQTLALGERPVYTGLTYTVTATQPPTGVQLSGATDRVPAALRQFLAAPPAPPIVESLLAKAPQGAYAKLQYLRAALYAHFTAAGVGKPTDVSAARVAQLLAGGTGNPYELTASEALLARWAGIPSRMGYGYYNGQHLAGGSVQFRPANAATYLEIYLAPYGWVPVLGTPPRARESLSSNQQKTNPQIKASPDLGLQVFLPVRQADTIPFYAFVRYYAVRVLPLAGGAGLLLLVYPLALKRLRRRRRARWAAAHGPAGQVAVAYCDLRDRLLDLALPGRGATPLELVEMVDDDEEHTELAWLVTRGLWGDLRGQLGNEDAENAHALAASVAARVAKAQPETARLLAAISRASLKEPYNREVPNAWRQIRLPRLRLRLSPRKLRPGLAAAPLVVLLLTLFSSGCAGPHATQRIASVAFPSRIAPSLVAGLAVHDESKASAAYRRGLRDRNVIVTNGKVISFSRNGMIQAALQVAQLKPGYLTSDPAVVKALTDSLATGGLITRLRAQEGHQLYSSIQGSERIYLWFPTTQSMALLVVRAQITQGAAEALARALIHYGDGGTINETALAAAFAATLPPATGATSTPPAAARQAASATAPPAASTAPKRQRTAPHATPEAHR
jgi:hypothetical protein